MTERIAAAVWTLVISTSLIICLPELVSAAEPVLAQAPAAPSGKNWVIEGVLVGLLFAAALFAICRSSRRA